MVWDSNQNRWEGSYTYCIIGSDWQHPDTYSSARVWEAPQDGTIRIQGTASREKVGGDGVDVKIVHETTTVWGTNTVAYDNTTGISHDFTLSVNAGDEIYFIVEQKSTTAKDTTIWDPTINYE